MNRRTWILSEVFHPETEGVAYLLEAVTKGMVSKGEEVTVLCAHPSYSLRGEKTPKHEDYEGTMIRRCFSTRLDRQRIVCRLINACTLLISMFCVAVFSVRRQDTILATTNPPLITIVAYLVACLRGCRLVAYVNDVYPGLAIAAGVCSETSYVARIWSWFNGVYYARASAIVVVGRDMKSLLIRQHGISPDKVICIPQCADTATIAPHAKRNNPILLKNGLIDSFVVLVAGNLGPVHDVESLMEAARLVQSNDKIKILIIGSGKKFPWVMRVIQDEERGNVVVLPRMPRSETCNIVNACDVAMSTLFIPGMYGLACASRSYAILAAGKPMIAVTDSDTEIAHMIDESSVGWHVRPGDAQGLAEAIENAYQAKDSFGSLAIRARGLAEGQYSRHIMQAKFCDLLCSEKVQPAS